MIENFNVILQTTTDNFLNWVYSELPKREGKQLGWDDWDEDIPKDTNKGVISVTPAYIPPFDIDNPHQLYSLDFCVCEKTEEDLVFNYYTSIIEVREITEGRIQAICRSDENHHVQDFIEIIKTKINKVFSPQLLDEDVKQTIPQKPEKPREGAIKGNIDHWFDWYHDCIRAGYKVTLDEIAEETGYVYGTVKNKHSLYLRERGK